MITKAENELSFVKPDQPIPTVEVDVDSIPEELCGYEDSVAIALENYLAKNPDGCASIYVYKGNSVNFRDHTFSIFLGVAGSKNILEYLLAEFKKIRGVRARYSDYINYSSGTHEFHIEDGLLWRSEEAYIWYAEEAKESKILIEEETPEEEDEWDDSPAEAVQDYSSTTRNAYPSRYRAARSDARIGSIRKVIEEVFGLPEGSVALRDPQGRNLRSDARIGTLRKRWE